MAEANGAEGASAREIQGTCHCGAVGWALHGTPASATACNCTICRRFGSLWTYGFIDHDIHVSGAAKAYRRKDGGAIDFFFCATCGCATHYIATKAKPTGNPDAGKRWTAVNLRMTIDSDVGRIETLPVDHFDGHGTFEDLPRDGRVVKDMWF